MREMKESGIEWIKAIPSNWNISKIDQLYVPRNTKVSDFDYQPLSVTMQGIVPQLESAAKTNAHDSRKLVMKGDFAINSRSDRRGSCGISEYTGSVSLINTVLKPKEDMNARYYNWLFHTSMFSDEFYRWGHGIVDDLWSTGWQEMKKISIPSPSLDEQHKIADFLDQKCSEIDALTADIQTQIETLEEYKKSVITEAVTKGLDPNVEMQDSGVEWIGKIPADWNVTKIKYLFSSGKGLSITKADLEDNGLPVISYGQIHSKENTNTDIKDCLIRFVDNKYEVFKQCKVNQYDFVFADTSEDYDGCGNCCYKRDNSTLYAGYHSIVLHSFKERDNRFLAYLFKTDSWRKQLRETASGVKVFSITQKKLINTAVILPPENQRIIIANFLDQKCSEIDQTISEKQQQIETLAEYKKSLIYEYVTGKKEVA
mgnify:CR=1 FL=1